MVDEKKLRGELAEREKAAEAVSSNIEQINKQISALSTQRNQAVADFNAIKGAIQQLRVLLGEEEPKTEEKPKKDK